MKLNGLLSPPGWRRVRRGSWARAKRIGKDRDSAIYAILIIAALALPATAQFALGDSAGVLLDQASSAGVYVLLAIGLNVVVGFAGLLDLGYAAFFAIGAYTYCMLASGWLAITPLHHAIHIPFWALLFLGMAIAGVSGAILGAPTLRLRGDYLAIVTLGFGEIVPDVFRNLVAWTGGVNGITAVDQPALPLWIDTPLAGLPLQVSHNLVFGLDPTPYYIVIVILIFISVILVTNLYRSRLGRAWMAIREDEVAAAAMGVNPVTIKLLAFSIGASFSGFGGAFFAAKLGGVTPELFTFYVSVTILVMIVLGGMGNIPGVMLGALGIYFLQNKILPSLPDWSTSFANSVGLGFLNQSHGDWSGLGDEVQRLNFIIFGLILIGIMVFRPQGLLPSRLREVELTGGTTEQAVFDTRTA